MEKIEIKVSATSANMGPGFDSVGMALSLYNTLIFEKIPEGLQFEGCEEKFSNRNNLAFVAYKKVLDRIGERDDAVKITIRTEIPVSRGLGSSAALIAAGAAAANYFCGSPLSKSELITLCTEIEGHPDNLAPAFLGGLVASATTDSGIASVKYGIDGKYKFTVLIPDYKLNTERARKALPKTVSMSDAVINLSDTAVMLKSLETGDTETLRKVTDDRLHQPYRQSLIPGWDTAKAAATECKADAFFISGSGPTLLCISERENFSKEIREILLRKGLGSWDVRDLSPDMNGIRIREI